MITPAVAGPYDLGTVVVRVALNVEPGNGTDQRGLRPDPARVRRGQAGHPLDRRQRQPGISSCSTRRTAKRRRRAARSTAAGRTRPIAAAFSSYPVSAPYQATECNKLAFKPKLFTQALRADHSGPRTRASGRSWKHAQGDANLSRAALTLPHSLFLDQSHIKTVCTRVQLAAKECPKNSVYGSAEAKTPLLDKKLKGPVYLVSSNDKLPDLVADLRGQVNIQLRGVISSKHGGLKTVSRRCRTCR